jgi:chaperone BCS1
MTTNHLKVLDPALIRPGRVDLQVQFRLATREQIRDMFYRMYSKVSDQGTKDKTATICNLVHNRHDEKDDLQFDLRPYITKANGLGSEELKIMAESFASRIPEDVFSPADIQGYLLARKQDPSRALKEIEIWKDNQMGTGH